jgi:hypothetical protein
VSTEEPHRFRTDPPSSESNIRLLPHTCPSRIRDTHSSHMRPSRLVPPPGGCALDSTGLRRLQPSCRTWHRSSSR